MKNYAFLGVGHIHTPNFIDRINARETASAVSVWDHDTDRAAASAEKLGCSVAASPEDVCADPSVDAVVICSETKRHPELVKLVCDAGKHVFVEKPLGMNGAEATELAGRIGDAGVIFQTGYFMRSAAEYRFLKQHVEAGTFGPIYRVNAANCHKGAIVGLFDQEWRWMADTAQAGCGGFGDLGFHSLDLMIWMFGEVESVCAMIGGGTKRYGDTDELGEGLLRFKSGTLGTLTSGWTDWLCPQKFLISGKEGTAAVLADGLHLQCKKITGMEEAGKYESLPEPLGHAFELFLDAIETGQRDLLVPVGEAAYGNKVIEALYRSAREGKEVPVD